MDGGVLPSPDVVLVVDDPEPPPGRVVGTPVGPVVVVVRGRPESMTSCGTPHAVATRARVSERSVARRRKVR